MYRIQTHPMLDYCVGHDKHGQAVLLGIRYPYLVAVLFDQVGRLVEIRIRPLGFQAPAIYKGGPYITEDPLFLEKVHNQRSQWEVEFGFKEGPIVVERFFLPQLLIGIEDLPRHLQRFLHHPTEFSTDEQSNYPAIIQDWRTNGNCVLWWGTDYYLNRDGEVI
jgi:hypothetical protein